MKNVIMLCLVISGLSVSRPVLGQETDCPFGLVNDAAPGLCARYIDTDRNDLCDLSEVPLTSDLDLADKSAVAYLSEAELKKKTVKEAAEIYGIETGAYRAALSDFLKIDVKGGDSLLELHDNYGLCAGVAANIALGIKNSQSSPYAAETKNGENIAAAIIPDGANDNKLPRYRVLSVAVVLTILYLITRILVLQKKLAVFTMRRIWNVVLLLSFAASSLMGLLLIARINWGFILPWPFDLLYWHVESGAVMAIVSIFHIAWHWRYYWSMIRIKN